MFKFKIKKGDIVTVISGDDKGKQGKVLHVLKKLNKVIVSGVNIVKKHMKPSKVSEGGIVQKEMPVHISNISYFDPKLNIGTRLGFKFLENGKKVRITKKSGSIIDLEKR